MDIDMVFILNLPNAANMPRAKAEGFCESGD
jgi:hypothetical protein